MAQSSNVFRDCCRLADSLGAVLPAVDPALTADLEAACSVADAYRDVYRCQLDVLEQEDYAAWEHIVNPEVLRRRESGLAAASSTLRSVLDNKDAIAKRLRDASAGPSISLDPKHQPDLSALVQHSAGGKAILEHGQQALEWAAAFRERPSWWEDKLHVVPEALQAYQQHHQALHRFGDAMAAHTGQRSAGASSDSAPGQ